MLICPKCNNLFDISNEGINVPKFKCTNCGYIEDIKSGSTLFSVISENVSQNYDITNFDDLINSSILPRTRKYVCPNDKCESHNDFNKKLAVFFRFNRSYKLGFICLTCKTKFQ
jgi:DNA-directed RNA polymerase subunit M/transcription elongation factor TFIIS